MLIRHRIWLWRGKGTQVTSENSQKHRVTRNISHFKRFNNFSVRTDESEMDSDSDNGVQAEQCVGQERMEA